MGLVNWYTKNKKAITAWSVVSAAIGSTLWVINLLGFSTNPQHYYSAWGLLDPNLKINVVLIFNIIFTFIVATIMNRSKPNVQSASSPNHS